MPLKHKKINYCERHIITKTFTLVTLICLMMAMPQVLSSASAQVQPIIVGDLLAFGRYEQDNDLANGQETIQWRVLAVEAGKALLISTSCLDNKPYASGPGNFSVRSFSLQEWLNDEFMEVAFTQEEQEIILTLNGEKPNNNRTKSQNINDKVFLLSIEEADNYFVNDDARKAPNTEYAILQGAYSGRSLGEYGRWWLRSAGKKALSNRDNIAHVFFDGHINSNGTFSDSPDYQVRPALYIDLSSKTLGVSILKIQKKERSNLPMSVPEESTVFIHFGHYEQDYNRANGKELIAWRVLAIEGNKVLLLSEKCLDLKPYEEERKAVNWDSLQSLQESFSGKKEATATWETCTLRNWLNDEFLNAAFTLEEQQAILTTEVLNEDNPRYITEAGKATSDKVFLLSIADAKSEEYFNGDADRKAPSTTYAISGPGEEFWGYWLRSPGYERHVATVEYDGTVDLYGSIMSSEYYTVRPAMYIKLSSGIF